MQFFKNAFALAFPAVAAMGLIGSSAQAGPVLAGYPGEAMNATGYAHGLTIPPASTTIVTPLDTFSISMTGQTTTPAAAFLITAQLTSVFGTTADFESSGLDGQTVTVSSSETQVGLVTTDTFTISVPDDFISDGTLAPNGSPFTSMFINIGNANAGGNVVNFAIPLNPATYSDFFTTNLTGASQFTFTQTFGGGNTTLLGSGGIGNGGNPISGLGLNSFTVSISYQNVPEPTSFALLALGAIPMLRRRRA